MSGFKFAFALGDEPDDDLQHVFATPQSESPQSAQTAAAAFEPAHQPSADVPLSDLLAALPETISYSPVGIPGTSTTLARRDLFDARFQLIAAEGESQRALGFVDAPSDLVPGVYEGGLKTWECSLDLAAYLQGELGAQAGAWVRGKALLELGCGTALPSVFLVSQLFAAVAAREGQRGSSADTHVHLQDYNRSVLELVTLPNLVLAWYMSPLSAPHLSAHPPPADDAAASPDPRTTGDLTLTPALLAAFAASLAQHRIHLRFSTGAWDGLALARQYDVVLTSETIYRPESLRALLRALQDASLGARVAARADAALARRAAGLSVETAPPLCLVAAKVLYFGVGGGVKEFLAAVEGGGLGTVATVWENRDGVGRRIMRVVWSEPSLVEYVPPSE